jgi:hypothetical protein
VLALALLAICVHIGLEWGSLMWLRRNEIVLLIDPGDEIWY